MSEEIHHYDHPLAWTKKHPEVVFNEVDAEPSDDNPTAEDTNKPEGRSKIIKGYPHLVKKEDLDSFSKTKGADNRHRHQWAIERNIEIEGEEE